MSNMTVAQALAESGKWGNLIRALLKLQETAEFLNAREQLEGERQVRLDALQAEIEAATAAIADAKAHAEKIVEAAQAAAGQARVDAADAVAWARKEASEVQADAVAARAAAEHARDEAQEARSLTSAAQEELTRLRANIAAARADALKRIGG